jgi:hypothetical protein
MAGVGRMKGGPEGDLRSAGGLLGPAATGGAADATGGDVDTTVPKGMTLSWRSSFVLDRIFSIPVRFKPQW